jgi:hypothetical protein
MDNVAAVTFPISFAADSSKNFFGVSLINSTIVLVNVVFPQPCGALTPTTIGFGVLPAAVVPSVALCVRSLDTTSSYTGM